MSEDFFFSIGSLIIDDIVQANGRTHMKTLGGGATHAVMGMRVWADQVGLLARLAQDFETADFPALEQYFDLSGLEKFQATRTPRAWQLIAEDGFRNEIFQTSFADLPSFVPEPAALQGRYRTARGVHLHADPQKIENWVRFLRENPDLIILWEPWDPFCQPENLAEFYRLARQVDIVSPNINESRQLTSIHEPEKIALEWRRNGVRKSLIRLGAAGCQVCGETGDPQTVAAYPVKKIVDVTGAGNACCGGFIVGLARTGSLLEAARYGNISASFALRQYGALYPIKGVRKSAEWRLRRYPGRQ